MRESEISVFGHEERCTGDSARRIGHEFLFPTLAQQNIATLDRYKVKKIVTACPHCFNTIKNEYPQLGGNYEVVHHSEYLAELVAQGRLKPRARRASSPSMIPVTSAATTRSTMHHVIYWTAFPEPSVRNPNGTAATLSAVVEVAASPSWKRNVARA